MKEIENKQFPNQVVGFFELGLAVMNVIEGGKGSVSEIRSRIRVIDALEQAKANLDENGVGTCLLEDADFDKLKQCFTSFNGWAVPIREIPLFEDYLSSFD